MQQPNYLSSSRRVELQVVKNNTTETHKPLSLKAFPVNKTEAHPHITPLQQQTMRIHYLTQELTQAIYDLKQITSAINSTDQAKICEYQTIYLPKLLAKSNGSFILTSEKLDLFQAEKQAYHLAKKLRQRHRKK
jgi:hypothetical protein